MDAGVKASHGEEYDTRQPYASTCCRVARLVFERGQHPQMHRQRLDPGDTRRTRGSGVQDDCAESRCGSEPLEIGLFEGETVTAVRGVQE